MQVELFWYGLSWNNSETADSSLMQKKKPQNKKKTHAKFRRLNFLGFPAESPTSQSQQGKSSISAVICQLWGIWKCGCSCADWLQSLTPWTLHIQHLSGSAAQRQRNKLCIPQAQRLWLVEVCRETCIILCLSLPFTKQIPLMHTPLQRLVLMLYL